MIQQTRYRRRTVLIEPIYVYTTNCSN